MDFMTFLEKLFKMWLIIFVMAAIVGLFIFLFPSCTTQIRAEKLELNGQIGKPSPTRMPDTIVLSPADTPPSGVSSSGGTGTEIPINSDY